jgi:CheY-like chemotaxis protein
VKIDLRNNQIKATRAPHVLIIDDDVDSALAAEAVFAQLGCPTVCSLSYSDGKKEICALNADIIVLDWSLDHEMDARKVVQQCSQIFAKFYKPGELPLGHKPKIITYSTLSSSEIKQLDNSFFEHIDHWQKPISQRELLTRSLSLLNQMHR